MVRFLDRADLSCLRPLGALRHGEFHALRFLQRLETRALNLRKMREQVLAAIIRCDEAVTLRIVKPLDDASCQAYSVSEKK